MRDFVPSFRLKDIKPVTTAKENQELDRQLAFFMHQFDMEHLLWAIECARYEKRRAIEFQEWYKGYRGRCYETFGDKC